MLIALLTVPFWGHLNSILALATWLEKSGDQVAIYTVEWPQVRFPTSAERWLKEAKIPLIRKQISHDPGTRPTQFICSKLITTIPWLKSHLIGFELIIYDFFMMEGNIVGRMLNIPTVSSIPAFLGENKRSELLALMAPEKKIVQEVNSCYGVDIWKDMESASDGLIIPCDLNLIWAPRQLMELGDFDRNRSHQHFRWVYYELPVSRKRFFPPAKKKIYCSFGTVVMGNLARNNVEVRTFVNKVLDWLCFWTEDNGQVSLIISSAGGYCFPTSNPKIQVLDFVPQKELLQEADLFITHGGGNGVNEAILTETPMLVIPFFGDQLHLAETITKAGLGLSYPPDSNQSLDTEHGMYERESLTKQSFIAGLRSMLGSDTKYHFALAQYRENHLTNATPLINLSKRLKYWTTHQSPLSNWQEGDLLFGTTKDRVLMAEMIRGEKFFKIGDLTPFYRLFDDHDLKFPRLVDQYHDIITNKRKYDSFCESDLDGVEWVEWLMEYRRYLLKHLDNLQPIGQLPFPSHASPIEVQLTLWNMCLCGLDFFLIQKKVRIHFIIGDYDSSLNAATSLELKYIKKFWSDPIYRSHVRFYKLSPKDGKITLEDPERNHWFFSKAVIIAE